MLSEQAHTVALVHLCPQLAGMTESQPWVSLGKVTVPLGAEKPRAFPLGRRPARCTKQIQGSWRYPEGSWGMVAACLQPPWLWMSAPLIPGAGERGLCVR